MTTLYRARYLLPMVAPPIEDGGVLVTAGRIVAVGAAAVLRREAATVVDCGDGVLLPPLINAHTHLELTDFPLWSAATPDLPSGSGFVDWIRRVIRVKRARSAEDYAASVANGIRHSLAAGTGAVGDILTWLPGRAQLAGSPLGGRLYIESVGLTEERYAPLLATARETAALLGGRLRGGLSPHAPYTVSTTHLAAALQADLPLAIHCAESREEVDFVRHSAGALAEVLYPLAGWAELLPSPNGLSPVVWLDRQGALTPRMLLAHGVQVDTADVELIACRGAGVVLCPRSNAALGVGTAPAALYRRHGVPLALGTDSLASNDSLSLWDELAAARRVYPEFTPQQLLELATTGGAGLLGLSGEMGALHVGAGAHFQLLRPAHCPAPGELMEFLCSPGRTAEVAGVWLDGERVTLDRHHGR